MVAELRTVIAGLSPRSGARGQNPDPQVGEQGPLEIFRVSVQGLRLPIASLLSVVWFSVKSR